MSMTDDVNALSPQSAAEAIDELRSSGALDALLAKIDAGELQLTGQGGFVLGLIKAALERGPQAELTEHVGYERGEDRKSVV